MSLIDEVAPADRANLAALFADPRPLSPGVDMVLEGLGGAAFVDDATAPNSASLTLGSYAYFGGDASSDGANGLVDLLDDGSRLMVGDQRWINLAITRFAGVERLHRMTFSRDALNIDILRQQSHRISDTTQIVPVGLDLARQMMSDVDESLIGVFPDPEAFIRGGMGYVAVRGEKVICGATSAMMSADAIEIQITTADNAQRQGLATAVSATLIVECLERGIEPHWSTTNDPSRGLAEKLGYVMNGAHETLVRSKG
ncbi:MAG: GNAT family N-acetyltransferase [Chloroflexi bacterium]|nr:GNAT family N-acetyltransferase [Chloroflexota bacterium]